MAATESKFKQRLVGVLILIALAVIFLPMLFKKDAPTEVITVEPLAMPETPAVPEFPAEEVAVPEPVIDETYELVEDTRAAHESAPTSSIPEASKPVRVEVIEEEVELAPAVAAKPAPAKPAPAPAKPAPAKPVTAKPAQKAAAPGLDKNNLPVSWSVQIASLTNKANAEALRDSFRKKQYNAYVRSSGGTHRVLIGPLVKDAEARALCKSLKAREKQDCFVVRYEP